MAKGKGINLNLPSADDLFSTQEERDEVKREMIMRLRLMKSAISRITRLR